MTLNRDMDNRADTGDINVLVADTHAIGMIGVIRSLGQAGYKVHAVSANAAALGFFSNFCFKAAQHPGYNNNDFAQWLLAYIEDNRIKAIVPSEGFLHACSDLYEVIKPLIPDAVDKTVWQRCLSKIETQECLTKNPQTGAHLPAGLIIRKREDIPAVDQLASLTGPFYIKGDAGHAIAPNTSAVVTRCETVATLTENLKSLIPSYKALIFQQYAPGLKVGVSLWRHQGCFCAENMTLGIHMMPWQGGMMTLRRTFWHDRLLADAKRKMEALGWEGVAMMEYKWDPETDDFWFIEINARYWGYLHLDLYAGKNFPLLQMDAYFGNKRTDLGQAKTSQICRYSFPGEANYLISRVKSDELSVIKKAGSFLAFFLRFFDPRIKADLWYPGDRHLYWRGLWYWIKDFCSGVIKRLT